MRSKLIDLTRLLNTIVDWDLPELVNIDTKRLAERLIAHGVTVREKGEWKSDCIAAVCDQCGTAIVIEQYNGDMNYCMNCGAKMDGDSDEG